jgi:hypothetical protein
MLIVLFRIWRLHGQGGSDFTQLLSSPRKEDNRQKERRGNVAKKLFPESPTVQQYQGISSTSYTNTIEPLQQYAHLANYVSEFPVQPVTNNTDLYSHNSIFGNHYLVSLCVKTR